MKKNHYLIVRGLNYFIRKRIIRFQKVKYVFIPMKAYSLYIFCRFLDQSFQIYEKDDIILKILCKAYVCSLAAINEESHFSQRFKMVN